MCMCGKREMLRILAHFFSSANLSCQIGHEKNSGVSFSSLQSKLSAEDGKKETDYFSFHHPRQLVWAVEKRSDLFLFSLLQWVSRKHCFCPCPAWGEGKQWSLWPLPFATRRSEANHFWSLTSQCSYFFKTGGSEPNSQLITQSNQQGTVRWCGRPWVVQCYPDIPLIGPQTDGVEQNKFNCWTGSLQNS